MRPALDKAETKWRSYMLRKVHFEISAKIKWILNTQDGKTGGGGGGGGFKNKQDGTPWGSLWAL
jgi:hypothetical protein